MDTMQSSGEVGADLSTAKTELRISQAELKKLEAEIKKLRTRVGDLEDKIPNLERQLAGTKLMEQMNKLAEAFDPQNWVTIEALRGADSLPENFDTQNFVEVSSITHRASRDSYVADKPETSLCPIAPETISQIEELNQLIAAYKELLPAKNADSAISQLPQKIKNDFLGHLFKMIWEREESSFPESALNKTETGQFIKRITHVHGTLSSPGDYTDLYDRISETEIAVKLGMELEL